MSYFIELYSLIVIFCAMVFCGCVAKVRFLGKMRSGMVKNACDSGFCIKNNIVVNQAFSIYFCRKKKKNLSVSKKVVLLHSHLRKKDWKMQTVR